MPIKKLELKPLTGILDTRSSPDMMPGKSYRFRQNFMSPEMGKMCRRSGHEKLFSEVSPYNNQDLHDQLLALLDETGVRQPVTFLFQAVSADGQRIFYAGTNSRIYELNESTGNWRVIAEGKGSDSTSCSAERFYAGNVGDYVVFTNGLDRPFYRVINQGVTDGNDFITELPDLELIGLSRASVIWEFKGCIFLADVVMDGKRYPNRFLWSDYNKPISFDPAVEGSITNSIDLAVGEVILAGKEHGNSFLIYTNIGIWELTAVGGDRSFAARKRYSEPKNRKGCLKYRNTLVSVGDFHYYMGEDAIYKYSPYYQAPDPQEDWLHPATGRLFADIDSTCCEVPVAEFYPNAHEIWLSYPITGSDCCPARTIIINDSYKFVDEQDFGWSAFANFQSSKDESLREWMIRLCICTEAQLIEDGYGYTKEGLPATEPEGDCEVIPTVIHTHEVLDYGGGDVEDYTEEESAEDSICAVLDGARIDSFCRGCADPAIFVGASVGDFCLKQIGGIYARERCTNPTEVGSTSDRGYLSSVGTYALDGYDSILRGNPLFGEQGADAIFHYLKIEAQAAPQTVPSDLQLRLGQSSQVADPNTDECGLVWYDEPVRALRCLNTKTQTQHKADNTRPAEMIEWNLFRQAPYLYWELKISGTGGSSCFSKFDAKVSAENICVR